MKKVFRLSDFWVIILVFVISRVIVMFLGIRMNLEPLYIYWQYLNVETLKHHLWLGIWYDHAQPPVFNLFLGFMLKIFGEHVLPFAVVYKIISLLNGLLLFAILKKFTRISFLPLVASLAYLLSPATLIFECELFYTTLVTLLLLSSVYALIRLQAKPSALNALGFFLPIALLCLTRSVYHILWLLVITGVLLFYFRGKPIFRQILTTGILSVLLVAGWYVKNKMLFGKFTLSTWVGMNMARNVFHDNEVTDSGQIAAFGTFSRISDYKRFIDPEFEKKYRGLNDRDLLQETKQDSVLNEHNVNYIPVSDQFQKASMDHIKAHPAAYLQNVVQSGILYFTPATVYSLALEQADKIKYYDVAYSFNLTHFAKSKQGRRIALTLSAIPKLFLYFLVFLVVIRNSIRNQSITSWNLFILLTISFVFVISSFLEHYENMRFRFETEPLFLILAAQALGILYHNRQQGKPMPAQVLDERPEENNEKSS
jgi:hypothetical protein